VVVDWLTAVRLEVFALFAKGFENALPYATDSREKKYGALLSINNYFNVVKQDEDWKRRNGSDRFLVQERKAQIFTVMISLFGARNGWHKAPPGATSNIKRKSLPLLRKHHTNSHFVIL
jgi:hypothetical protein